MTVLIRNLIGADAEAVYAVALKAWQFTYGKILDPAFIEQFVNTNYAPDHLRDQAQRVAENKIYFAVAEQGAKIIGFCNIGITQQGPELLRIYLLPEFIGRGVGKDLLAKGEQYLRDRGFDSYFCFVESANEIGKRFYQKQGFHHIIERDQDGAWFMQKELG